MTHEEFSAWLDIEVEGNRMPTSQRRDLLAQKALFDSERAMIEREFRNQIVGYIADVLRSGHEIHEFNPVHGFLWEHGVLTDLNTLIPANSDQQLITAQSMRAGRSRPSLMSSVPAL